MVALPVAISITLTQELLFSAAETFNFLGMKTKSFNTFLGRKLERFLLGSEKEQKSKVTFDKWGGTSVNPSEVFRTERGRKGLEGMAELAERHRILPRGRIRR